MQKQKVKVVIWGFGAMGSGMAKMILNKQGIEIVGVCDRNPDYIGKTVDQILNTHGCEIIIKDNIEDVVAKRSCDVVLLATDSFTKPSFPKIKWLLEHQVNVISTAEEMAYPQASNPEVSAEIDRIAKENKVSVLGTGVNPGMMMDLLVICLTGVMEEVNKISVSRINSLSPFGKTVMEEQGVGLSIDEFNNKNKQGKISGHVGFNESITMIGDALGWKIDKINQQMQPIITNLPRTSPYGFAEAGHVAGVDMKASGYLQDKAVITMNHPQQIEPQIEQTQTGDYITINGTPEINMAITPEVDGGIGTIAICVNMIPHVINAKPGLKTMIDLPVPRALMGDIREMID